MDTRKQDSRNIMRNSSYKFFGVLLLLMAEEWSSAGAPWKEPDKRSLVIQVTNRHGNGSVTAAAGGDSVVLVQITSIRPTRRPWKSREGNYYRTPANTVDNDPNGDDPKGHDPSGDPKPDDEDNGYYDNTNMSKASIYIGFIVFSLVIIIICLIVATAAASPSFFIKCQRCCGNETTETGNEEATNASVSVSAIADDVPPRYEDVIGRWSDRANSRTSRVSAGDSIVAPPTYLQVLKDWAARGILIRRSISLTPPPPYSSVTNSKLSRISRTNEDDNVNGNAGEFPQSADVIVSRANADVIINCDTLQLI